MVWLDRNRWLCALRWRFETVLPHLGYFTFNVMCPHCLIVTHFFSHSSTLSQLHTRWQFNEKAGSFPVKRNLASLPIWWCTRGLCAQIIWCKWSNITKPRGHGYGCFNNKQAFFPCCCECKAALTPTASHFAAKEPQSNSFQQLSVVQQLLRLVVFSAFTVAPFFSIDCRGSVVMTQLLPRESTQLAREKERESAKEGEGGLVARKGGVRERHR